MYWEHTLAVLFCFIGMIILLKPKSSVTLQGAILSGIFVGLSAWIRSEFLAMIATLTFLVGLLAIIKMLSDNNVLKSDKNSISFAQKVGLNDLIFLADKGLIFIVSMYATVVAFFISNKLIYGHFLGIHALQIVDV